MLKILYTNKTLLPNFYFVNLFDSSSSPNALKEDSQRMVNLSYWQNLCFKATILPVCQIDHSLAIIYKLLLTKTLIWASARENLSSGWGGGGVANNKDAD